MLMRPGIQIAVVVALNDDFGRVRLLQPGPEAADVIDAPTIADVAEVHQHVAIWHR